MGKGLGGGKLRRREGMKESTLTPLGESVGAQEEEKQQIPPQKVGVGRHGE